jgi:hypothetical protein
VSSALQFSSRAAREKAFIVVWPGDDIVSLEFIGETVCAPPTDVVATAGQGRWRYSSAKDHQGRPIPGTVLIGDKYTDGPDGTRKSFDAEWFLFGDGTPGKGLIGVNEPLVARGLMIVDDPSQVAEAKRVGREMWEEKQAIADDLLIKGEWERRQRHQEKAPGTPVPVASDDLAVKAAVERQRLRTVKSRSTVSNDDLLAAMGATVAPVTTTAPAPAPATEASLSLDTIADYLFDTAEQHSVTLTKPQLKGLLKRDVAVMEEVRQALEAKGLELEK